MVWFHFPKPVNLSNSDRVLLKKFYQGKRIAFITGLAEESNPVITEEVMRCALKLQQEFNRQTYIFTGNLKVAGNGLEALYRQTKKAGTVFMKFTETIPDIHVNKDGNLTIVYVDEVIRETFKLNPDVTVSHCGHTGRYR